MQHPDQCTTLAEVRTEIDAIDQQIIALLGTRWQYVKAAARFKTSVQAVQDLDRQRRMLEQRRAWAEEADLDPDLIESIYHTLIRYFVEREQQHWQASR